MTHTTRSMTPSLTPTPQNAKNVHLEPPRRREKSRFISTRRPAKSHDDPSASPTTVGGVESYHHLCLATMWSGPVMLNWMRRGLCNVRKEWRERICMDRMEVWPAFLNLFSQGFRADGLGDFIRQLATNERFDHHGRHFEDGQKIDS